MNRKLKEVRENMAAVNKAYAHLFSNPDGEIVMADLERHFGGGLLKKNDGVVDANACIAAIGSHKVIKHIKDRTNDGNMAR